MISAFYRLLMHLLRACIAICNTVGRFARSRRVHGPTSVLDTVLFHWTRQDPFSVRNLIDGGVAILGRVGSGKSSSSGKMLGKSIVACSKSSGLILGAKPEDLAMWQQIFEAAGRNKDLLVFSPSEPHRFNFISYVLSTGGQTRDIVQCIRVIGESLNSGDASRGGDIDIFWKQQADRLIYNAVEIVQSATGTVSAPELQRFIGGAATSPDQLTTEPFKGGHHCQYLEKAHGATKSPVEAHDFQLAADYWLFEYPQMGEKMRSSILAEVMGILHVFNTGIVRELVSTSTNISPDVMLNSGKWVFVDMSPTTWGAAGSFVSAGWKYLSERAVLRRAAKPTDFFNVIWVDEAQQFANSHDVAYIAQCRSHLGALVFISQGLPSFYVAMKGDAGEHQTHSLLGNFTTTIFHAVDPITAEFACKKLGKRRESFFGGSSAPAADIYEQLFGDQQFTSSFSEHYEGVLQEQVFLTGMRTGSKTNGFACDAIVIRSGEPFVSSGESYLFTTFYQE